MDIITDNMITITVTRMSELNICLNKKSHARTYCFINLTVRYTAIDVDYSKQ